MSDIFTENQLKMFRKLQRKGMTPDKMYNKLQKHHRAKDNLESASKCNPEVNRKLEHL